MSSHSESAPPRERSVFNLTYRLVEDLQRVRLAHGNRVRQVLPLIPEHVQPPRGTPSWEAFFKASTEALEIEEKRILRFSERILKDDPLGRWMLAQKGIGPSLGVSILGELWPLDRFASPRKVWAYAGLHVDAEGKAVRRRKGVRANWNSRLKTRLYLFGCSILKAGDSPWRALYDTRKAYEIARAPSVFESPEEVVPGDDPDTGARSSHADQGSLAPGAQTLHDAQVSPAPGLGSQDAGAGPMSSATEPGSREQGESHLPTATGPRPLSKLQIHYRCLRVVEKALLLDLWRLSHGQPALVGVTPDA